MLSHTQDKVSRERTLKLNGMRYSILIQDCKIVKGTTYNEIITVELRLETKL